MPTLTLSLRYLMVDIVANNVMATSTTPNLSTYMFKEQVFRTVLLFETSHDMHSQDPISSILPD